MKKIYLLLLFTFLFIFSKGQVTLYTDSFTNGSAGWQLGSDGLADTWIVNNEYSCSVTTPNQGGGNYLHIFDDLDQDFCDVALFAESSGGNAAYATMTSGINSAGQTSVSIKFDWLCEGQVSLFPSFGSVDYSIDGGSNWTNITQPYSKYSGQSTWKTTMITSTQVPALLGHTDLRIRFGFTNSGVGQNPAFGVDNIVVSGDVATSVHSSLTNVHSDVNLFLNSSQNELTISGYALSGSSFVTIFNMIGENVAYKSFYFDNNMNSTSFDIKSLPAGIYVLQVQSEKGAWIRRF